MATESAPSVTSELSSQRKITLTVAALTLVLAFVFRNDRELLTPATQVADREASAFAATIAPPPVFAPGAVSGIVRPARAARGRGPGDLRANPAIAPESANPSAVGQGSAGEVLDRPFDQSLVSLLPQDSAGGRNGAQLPQFASFIGLPGGVLFRPGGSTPPTTTPTPAPTDVPTTPSNPDVPTTPATPTPTEPTPVNPSDPVLPTDPTNPNDPTPPGNPVLPPVAGPGAVPEPTTWALMILGIGFVGVSLRRRRRFSDAPVEALEGTNAPA